MSEVSVYEGDAFQQMEEVAKHMLMGHTEFKTARDLGMKVIEVRSLWENYKDRLNNDSFARDAAQDHLNLMVKQYDDLLVDLHENLKNLKDLHLHTDKISAQIVATTKTIADILAKRVDALQKAGMLDAHDLGDELAEREKQEAYLLEILRNDLCPECQSIVAIKLQKMTGEAEVIESEEVIFTPRVKEEDDEEPDDDATFEAASME